MYNFARSCLSGTRTLRNFCFLWERLTSDFYSVLRTKYSGVNMILFTVLIDGLEDRPERAVKDSKQQVDAPEDVYEVLKCFVKEFFPS